MERNLVFFFFKRDNKEIMDLLKKQYAISYVVESVEDEDTVILAEAIGRARAQNTPIMVVLNDHTSSQEEIVEVVGEMERLRLPIVIVSSSVGLKSRYDRHGSFPSALDAPVWWFGEEVQFVQTENDAPPDLSLYRQWWTASRRPVMIMGVGSDVPELSIPFVVIPESIGRISTHHPYFMGRFGSDGDRCGNFVVQNADLILVVGHLPFEITPSQRFAREAYVIQIGASSSIPHHMQLPSLPSIPKTISPEWIRQCRAWKDQWLNELPSILPEEETIHPYLFFPLLYDQHGAGWTIIARSWDAPLFYPIYQQITLRDRDDRFFAIGLKNALPFCRGVYAEGQRPMILFLGEKDLFRIQDLYTIVQDNVPLILMMFSEGGKNWSMGEDGFLQRTVDGEYSLEDLEAMVGIPSQRIGSYDDILEISLTTSSPLLLDVDALLSFDPHPVGSIDRPLEDMLPLLNEGHFRANMLIEPITRI